MIQDINFWFQFICGIIVGRSVIAETRMGRKFLKSISRIKSCLVDTKTNITTACFFACLLLFVFDLSYLFVLIVLSILTRIPDYIKEYQKGIFFKKWLLGQCYYWFIVSVISWFFFSNKILAHPFDWMLHFTNNMFLVFVYGTIVMILSAIVVDCIILYGALTLQRFLTGEGIFILATIIFFGICPIVEYSKIKNFQEIITFMEARKNKILNLIKNGN